MKIKHIAAVVSGLDEEYPYNIIRGINQFAAENGLNVSYFAAFGGVVDSSRFDMGEFSIYNLTDFSKFDGALLLSNTFSDPVIRGRITDKVKAAGIPAVIFECSDHEEFYDISIDNYSVMRELVEHIVKFHGAKVINYVSGPLANPEARSRYRAFRDVMEENGLKIDEDRIFHGFFRSFDGTRAIESFKESGLPLPDAFICANDSMALTAVSALEKMGIRVPEDVMVTGFDDTFNARNSCPVLTTVKRPLYKSGYKAGEILLGLMNGDDKPRSTVMEATPVFSESCGCKAEILSDTLAYRKSTYKRIEKDNSNVHMLNRLTAALAETRSAEECFRVIAGMVHELECDRFSLCLTSDWEEGFNTSSIKDELATYAPMMTAPIIWNKGRLSSKELFPSSDMFPEEFEDGGNISYFLPLHFGERCLGYYIITNSDFPIYSLLCHTFTMALSNSLENISKQGHINNAMEELNRLYITDPLCGIYNRSGFVKAAEEMFERSIAEGSPVMISFVDMDGLKTINDTYGHAEGDKSLKKLAGVIRGCCTKGAVCARIGGDEFVIFTPRAEGESDRELAERLQKALERTELEKTEPYSLSASIGSVIGVPKKGDTLSAMIDLADERMYEVKKNKKRLRGESTDDKK